MQHRPEEKSPGRCSCFLGAALPVAVHVAAVANGENRNLSRFFVDCVDHSIISNAQSKVRTIPQTLGLSRMRLIREELEALADPSRIV